MSLSPPPHLAKHTQHTHTDKGQTGTDSERGKGRREAGRKKGEEKGGKEETRGDERERFYPGGFGHGPLLHDARKKRSRKGIPVSVR